MLIIKLGCVLIAAACLLIGCGNQTRETTSNAGPDRTSLSGTPSPARSGTPEGAMNGQNNFWSEAAIGGMAEVELGQLAASKAQNADVKEFARMMVADHGRANEELKRLTADKKIQIPTDLDAKHRSTIDKLKGMSGADFDRAYVDEMVEDHEMDVKAFERQAGDDSDADAKSFAAKTLPTLKKHLEAIKQINAKMK